MPDFSRKLDPVILECPVCGAAEATDPALLGGARTIVCRDCGEAWPASVRDGPEPASAGSRRVPTLEAERRPFITYSSKADQAWAQKVAADVVPEERRRSRAPMGLAAVTAALFIGVFLAGREAAVTALPDLAGLYARLGMPVNLDGLTIDAVVAERSPSGDADRLTVRGTIRNVGRAEQPVPPLTASLYGGAASPAGVRSFDPPSRTIAVGEARPFLLELDAVPSEATRIVLRFRRPAEHPQGAREVAADLQ